MKKKMIVWGVISAVISIALWVIGFYLLRYNYLHLLDSKVNGWLGPLLVILSPIPLGLNIIYSAITYYQTKMYTESKKMQ